MTHWIKKACLALSTMAMLIATAVQASAVEAYIFRGAGDFTFIADRLSFSEGMDTLGDKVRDAGMHASVYRWEAGEFAYRDIMKRRPEAVALIGHSMGALTALAIAARLKGKGIRVAYLGTIDIPGPVGATPSNVEVAENFYHAFPVFGQLTAGPGHPGEIKNHFVWGQVHITMDNSKKVHNAMLTAMAQARGDGELMQAYAQDAAPQAEGTIVGEVDRVLTASTTNSGGAVELVDPVSAVVTSESVDGDFQHVAMLLPAEVPIPTPRPGRYNTASGLPPIE